ncbi:hypothetical protein G6F56_002570 [Rhizopus delemar]|nr:hypothetical protein G6F56_002570 [Rhizopus delemar]
MTLLSKKTLSLLLLIMSTMRFLYLKKSSVTSSPLKPEWSPHTKDGGYKTTSSSDPCGRFGFKMGNNVERSGDEWILDRNRKRNIDRREETTDDSIRSSAPRKKIQKQYDSHFFGQYNSAEICKEIGRYSLANTSGIGFGNSRDYDSTQIDNTLPTYLGGVKNIRADQLSRKARPLYECKLPRRFFNQIWENLGPMKVDTFAMRENTRLRRFWSLQPDPQVEATDAFRQTWPRQAYIYTLHGK